MDNICFYCNRETKPDGMRLTTNLGAFHLHCYKKHEEELAECEKRYAEYLLSCQKKIDRIKRNLSKTLKNKIWRDLKPELGAWTILQLEIVGVDKTEGTKVSGSEYFEHSTAIRHVYDDTGYTGYSDYLSGTISFYIGKQRYLKMHIQEY